MSDFDLQVAERLAIVQGRIDSAGGRSVEVVAVTKTWGVEAVHAAVRAGCHSIGESYAQEMVAKLADESPRRYQVRFIGRLQTNKVRALVGLVDVFETVDRESLIVELARRAPSSRVLIQVATLDEPGKGGCPLDHVDHIVDVALAAGLAVEGLMTVGPTEGGAEAARPGFRAVRRAVDRLGLDVCSMGMSADLEVAVQEGSTEVRMGSALFGSRPRRQ